MVFVVNSPIALAYLQGQPQYFQGKGFDVTILCPRRREGEWEVDLPEDISNVVIPMERNIAPLRDLLSLWRIWRAMRAIRPVVTNVGTPKAALLGGIAAWLNRVPCRVYTLHGLRFETTKGLKRQLLICAERLACQFAHRVLCVSRSVREKAITCGLTNPEKTVVIGSGSCNGVDTSRFAPNPKLIQRAAALRRLFRIPEKATVILFVGRLTRDKGIPELVEAFVQLDKQLPNLRLLLVGCFEAEDPLPAETRRQLEGHSHIIFAGAVRDTPSYYAAADIVVLPSHREGLPTVVLEAQAAGKPVVGAKVTGIVDLVTDGETGLLFPVGDAALLGKTLARLVNDDALVRKLEAAGREKVERDFQQQKIWDALYGAYMEVLEKNKSRLVLTKTRNDKGRSFIVRSSEH
ncbi:MAG TPA: glycosyltransferase family 4 protein [Candidatus Acidoferrales bacterium]|nr:glycosyltransferase family 4 protein [Candidatus Acidoferrales bacterium]